MQELNFSLARATDLYIINTQAQYTLLGNLRAGLYMARLDINFSNLIFEELERWEYILSAPIK